MVRTFFYNIQNSELFQVLISRMPIDNKTCLKIANIYIYYIIKMQMEYHIFQFEHSLIFSRMNFYFISSY